MALKPKHPHICIDDHIWDDPVIIGLSPSAFRAYIFAIAWSKCQGGRTRDGLLTDHGITRIGATPRDVEELVALKLVEKCNEGYQIKKYEEWQLTSEEAALLEAEAEVRRAEEARQLAEIDEQKEKQRQYGLQGAKKRWQLAEPPPLEEGFDVEANFALAWGEWPDASEAKFREKRDDGFESFRANITNTKDYANFSAALMKRIREFHSDNRPRAERRKYLGAFKNFCDGRWKDWIPKNQRTEADLPPISPEPEDVPQKPIPFTKFATRNEIVGGVSDADLVALLESQNPAA